MPSGGTRQYSLLDDPAVSDSYRIAIKREDDGKGGSKAFIKDTSVGDLVDVSEPINEFALREDGERIVLVAGGIGITPILSMAKFLQRTQSKPFKMYYLTRDPEHTAYLDEITAGPLRDAV
ncbi:MAG: ferredoxin reductase, partial [Hoeflea sp.]